MRLHRLSGRNAGGYTTFGGVWEKGEVYEPNFLLKNEGGKQVPVQSKIMAQWPDGSIKWSAHTADSEKMSGSVELLPIFSDTKVQLDMEHAIRIEKTSGWFLVDTGELTLKIPRGGSLPAGELAKELCFRQVLQAEAINPVLCLERQTEKIKDGDGRTKSREVQEYKGEIYSVMIEEKGPYQAVFCFRGSHVVGETAKMPFVIRMYLGSGNREIRFLHTFLYDGNETKDFLKGMGIRFAMPMRGKLYDRHIQYGTEGSIFHENAVILDSNRPNLPLDVLANQQAGRRCTYDAGSDVGQAAANLPIWQNYAICQDSAYHYAIRKSTYQDCCQLVCRQGRRSDGVMAVTGCEGGMLFGIRDFWKKYPSSLEVEALGRQVCQCTVWFYSPDAEAFDFRHYEKKSYPETCYEGFEEVGASAQGIGVTSECKIMCVRMVPEEAAIRQFAASLHKPAVYVGVPEYYYKKRAFGCWSLKQTETETERWLEEQLERAFDFYKEEIKSRDWYGLFDYGDVMHTYDAIRHCWKYDVGGYAWQNTELVPTYWLGLYFMRTGREDVFSVLEAMSRHCSEVDIYHFGQYQGLGSRHNVRHWGCSCKEPRIAMAGHYRFLYYLTGDLRLADIFDEVRDSDLSMENLIHSKEQAPDGDVHICVRSGPDWSSFVSNWMTWYERTLSPVYRDKILQGIKDIYETPYGLASGPDFYYDKKEAHLIYKGEIEKTPNQHLQICMGAPQIWLETADMLEDDRLNQLLAELGSFYFLDKAEKERLTEGKISSRPFSWPMFATGVSAYGAMWNKDADLAILTWKILLGDLVYSHGFEGYAPITYAKDDSGRQYKEIPWITTNCTSQWCLNVIMCLDFIREYLPDDLSGVMQLLEFNHIK